jgi:hypothetical protein
MPGTKNVTRQHECGFGSRYGGKGQIEDKVIDLLIQRGANPRIFDTEGYNCLHSVTALLLRSPACFLSIFLSPLVLVVPYLGCVMVDAATLVGCDGNNQRCGDSMKGIDAQR